MSWPFSVRILLFLVIFVTEFVYSGGKLLSLQELWSAVSHTLKLDVASADLWKVITQQVSQVKTLIEYFKTANAH